MAHVNYDMWSQYIKNLFQFADLKVRKVVDLSCGTGSHLAFIKSKKIQVVGADKSFEMLASGKRNNLNFIVNDAKQIAFKSGSFDVALMLYDSINYLENDDNIIILLNEAERILNPGGIFIFDFVTKEGLKECFDEYYESNTWDGLAYQRRSWFNAARKTQHNEFVFLYNGKSFMEEHTQYIRENDEWSRLVKKSKMNLIEEFSNFSFLPADSKSERVHFVCRKENK